MIRRFFSVTFPAVLALSLLSSAFGAEGLKLKTPEGDVSFFTPGAQAYLETPFAEADPAVHASGRTDDQGQAARLAWECSLPDVKEFRVTYASKTVTAEAGAREIEIRNLPRGASFQWSVTAVTHSGETRTAEGTFTTSDLGPRVILAEGIHNVRDLGGWTTLSGKKVRQGMLFRGSEMNGKHEIELTPAGRKVLAEELGIRTDLDLRSRGEALEITESPIGSGTRLVFHPIGAYKSAFTSQKYAPIFALFADAENYPIYFHCWGGADRAGTIAFLVNALLGVPEEKLIADYEFTSFSVIGIRSRNSELFQEFWTKLQEFEGETLAEKTEKYLLSIGVTAGQIQSIREIMLED